MTGRRSWLLLLVSLAAACVGCREPVKPTTRPEPRHCAPELPAPPQLPHEKLHHRLVDFWLQQTNRADQLLFAPSQVATFNLRLARLSHQGEPIGRRSLGTGPIDQKRRVSAWREQVARLRQALKRGNLVELSGAPATSALERLEHQTEHHAPADELRLARRMISLRCLPTEDGVYEKPGDVAFDVAQCSQVHPGEALRVLAKGEGWWYVRTDYATGWIQPDSLTPRIDMQELQRYLHPDQFVVVTKDVVAVWSDKAGGSLLAPARMGTRFPLHARDGNRFLISYPRDQGIGVGWIRDADAVSVGFPRFTRQALLRLGFSLLDTPYGWGGLAGHRDCSRFLMDLFQAFGLQLPRNSARQARVGDPTVDVSRLAEARKVELIERMSRRALLLLYMPGHIMLYLGRDGDQLYGLHLVSGYMVPCPRGQETMYRINRTVVTSLELGRGSSRRAFIERIESLVPIAPSR
jgi:hypothetical protein